MKVQVIRMLLTGVIGGQELQGSWHSVSRNIEEHLQNLLAKQAIIDNVGGSGRKWVREPNVRVSKMFNPNRRDIRVLEYRRGIKDTNTTQRPRGPVSHTTKLVKVFH